MFEALAELLAVVCPFLVNMAIVTSYCLPCFSVGLGATIVAWRYGDRLVDVVKSMERCWVSTVQVFGQALGQSIAGVMKPMFLVAVVVAVIAVFFQLLQLGMQQSHERQIQALQIQHDWARHRMNFERQQNAHPLRWLLGGMKPQPLMLH